MPGGFRVALRKRHGPPRECRPDSFRVRRLPEREPGQDLDALEPEPAGVARTRKQRHPGPEIVGTNAGHQISLDGGRTWENIQALRYRIVVPPFNSWQPFVFALDGNQVYAGDDRGGIWQLSPAFPEPATAIRNVPGKASPALRASGARLLLEARKVRLDGRAF